MTEIAWVGLDMAFQPITAVKRDQRRMLSQRGGRQKQIVHPRAGCVNEIIGHNHPRRHPAMLNYLEKLLTIRASGACYSIDSAGLV